MKLSEFLQNVEIQSEYKVVYFDDEKVERVEITDEKEVGDNEIKYVYCENDILFIEVEMDN